MKRISIEQVMTLKFPEWIGFVIARDPESGHANLMPAGWMMSCSFEPAMMAVAIGLTRHTHELLLKSPKFVLAFAGEGQADLVRQSGVCSGRDGDKFSQFNVPHDIGPETGCPILSEAAFNLECEVADRMVTGDHAIFAARILAAHVPDEPIRGLVNFGQDRYVPARPG